MNHPETCKTKPIVLPKTVWSWPESKQVPLQDNGEPLVSLGLIPEKILVSSQYFIQRIDGALPDIFARQGVRDRLVEAAASLPLGHRFVVYDCWRPLAVQLSLFEEAKRDFAGRYPDEGDDAITARALTFVALPSSDPAKPSPHNTGGAIDLSIVDDRGRALPMGSDYDATVSASATAYFEDRLAAGETLSSEEAEACGNRRLLYHVMIAAGFTNYLDEWWHFDFGNQNWAWVSGEAPAVYGRAAPDFPWNKTIR